MNALLYLWMVVPVLAADRQDGPARCEAVWIAPHAQCALQGTWAATGVGPTKQAARDKALTRLTSAVKAGAGAATARMPLVGLDPDGCAQAAVQAAHTTCFDEPQLTDKRLCYVDLPGTGCGDLPIEQRTGVVWKVMESGRNRLCTQVESATRNLPNAERLACASRCHQEARVRCPSDDVN